jgi:hypothetical protein
MGQLSYYRINSTFIPQVLWELYLANMIIDGEIQELW